MYTSVHSRSHTLALTHTLTHTQMHILKNANQESYGPGSLRRSAACEANAVLSLPLFSQRWAMIHTATSVTNHLPHIQLLCTEILLGISMCYIV